VINSFMKASKELCLARFRDPLGDAGGSSSLVDGGHEASYSLECMQCISTSETVSISDTSSDELAL